MTVEAEKKPSMEDPDASETGVSWQKKDVDLHGYWPNGGKKLEQRRLCSN